MTPRREQYPALPSAGWEAPKQARDARREAVDLRNALMAQGGAARAVAAVNGGTIGAGKIKEPKAAKKT